MRFAVYGAAIARTTRGYNPAMLMERTRLDLFMIALILFFAAFDVVAYSGFFDGGEIVRLQGARDLPEGNAPGLDELAEQDDDPSLPGVFVPTQGRRHVQSTYPLTQHVPFCEGEARSYCYASNPPTSGLHLGVQRSVQLEGGGVVDLPPPPGIYEFAVPRESIPHIQEHAGVYLGYNCASDACDEAVRQATGIVEDELALGRRVVMSPDMDLDADTIALASWTRVDSFDAAEYGDGRVREFIRAHSCRFDPEGFCDGPST